MDPAQRRGCGIHKEELLLHKEALAELVKVSPNGFPAQSRLAYVLQCLHRKHNIFGVHIVDVTLLANTASDKWRIMIKDLVRLARQGGDSLHPGIVELVGMLEVDNTTASSASASANKIAS